MWAVLLGLAFRAADKMTKKVLADVADGISMVVTWIINLAPFGIFGLVFNTVSTNGLDIFTTYGKLLLLLVGCMLFIYFVTNPLLVYWCIRQNPYPLIFHCLKRSALTAFFTRSSAANIPVNMKVCEEMGLDRDTYSVTIPLGATINMDGAAITITVMTMATAFTLDFISCKGISFFQKIFVKFNAFLTIIINPVFDPQKFFHAGLLHGRQF